MTLHQNTVENPVENSGDAASHEVINDENSPTKIQRSLTEPESPHATESEFSLPALSFEREQSDNTSGSQTSANQHNSTNSGPSSRRKRRQDWCRWPVCEEFRLTGKCSVMGSAGNDEGVCMYAHVGPTSNIPVTTEGEVRVCFDSMGLTEVACSRTQCHFYHPPKPIRDQIVSRRHAQYLREKVLRLGSTNASLSNSFIPSGKPNNAAHLSIHGSNSRLNLPATLQQNEATLPGLTQWNIAALNALLAQSVQANSRHPISSTEWTSVESNPMNAPTAVPLTQAVTTNNALPVIESSDISNPISATFKRHLNGVLLSNVPCTAPSFSTPTGPIYDPSTHQLNLPLLPYQRICEPYNSLNINLLNALLNIQAQTGGIPPIAVNDYLQQTTNPTCPLQLDILYNLQQQNMMCGLPMSNAWLNGTDMFLHTSPYQNPSTFIPKPNVPIQNFPMPGTQSNPMIQKNIIPFTDMLQTDPNMLAFGQLLGHPAPNKSPLSPEQPNTFLAVPSTSNLTSGRTVPTSVCVHEPSSSLLNLMQMPNAPK